MPDWLDGFDDLVIHYDTLLDALELERVHLVGYSLGGWIAAEFAVFHPRRLASLTLITPAGLRVPGRPQGDLFAMDPEALFMAFFNDPANAAEILPDLESLDEIEHQFGEMATLARLAWNPRFDPKLERRLEVRREAASGTHSRHDVRNWTRQRRLRSRRHRHPGARSAP